MTCAIEWKKIRFKMSKHTKIFDFSVKNPRNVLTKDATHVKYKNVCLDQRHLAVGLSLHGFVLECDFPMQGLSIIYIKLICSLEANL